MAFADEMRLFDELGQRLYCTASERSRFIEHTKQLDPVDRMYCSTLAHTGARPTEVRQLSVRQFDFEQSAIVVRSLKKRLVTKDGTIKKPQFRTVPVPLQLMEELDLTFQLRKLQRDHSKHDRLLWSFSRATAYRKVAKVFSSAEISGAMASPKGLRHAYGVAGVLSDIPLSTLAYLMGHSSIDTTRIYTQVVGEELRELALKPFRE